VICPARPQISSSHSAHLTCAYEESPIANTPESMVDLDLTPVGSCQVQMSIMEPVSNLDIDLPWIIPVETTKGLTVIEFHATVRHVESIH
jgi:hypothetical protein